MQLYQLRQILIFASEHLLLIKIKKLSETRKLLIYLNQGFKENLMILSTQKL